MTAALEGGEWSAARSGRTLPPGKTQYLFYRRLGGAQSRSRRAEILVPTGIRSRTVHPTAQSLYRLSYRAHHGSYMHNTKQDKVGFHPARRTDLPETPEDFEQNESHRENVITETHFEY